MCTSDGTIIIRCKWLRQERIQVIPPRRQQEPEELRKPRMSVGVRQACSRVADQNAPHCEAPRYVEPEYQVGRSKQVINPPQVDPLSDPCGPCGKSTNVDKSLRQRTLWPRTRLIPDLIKVGRRQPEPKPQPTGQ